MNRLATCLTVGALLSMTGCSHAPAAAAPPAIAGPSPPAVPVAAPEPVVSTCHPEVAFRGAPIEVPDASWTWVDFPEAKCRDGSSTGIGIRRHPGATKLVLYLEGGGACFHDASCLINDVLLNFGASAFGAWVSAAGSSGIFDSSRSDNPFHDWNVVYVPYCTGDVHAGSAEHVDVPGASAPKNQMFVGYRNIGLYLERLVPTFTDADHVVVTGISAGGFGAALNYDRVAQAFCHSRVTLVDDSGPPMSDQYLTPCLQQRWRDLWNLDAALPADCSGCRGADGGGIANYLPYLAHKYPDAQLGLVSANQDGIISLFFGFGANHCQGLTGASAGMSGATFEAGLQDLHDHYIGASDNLASYIVPSTSHTWITGLTFYSTAVESVALTSWTNSVVNLHTPMRIGGF